MWKYKLKTEDMPKKLRRKQKTLEEVKEITELKKSESAPQ